MPFQFTYKEVCNSPAGFTGTLSKTPKAVGKINGHTCEVYLSKTNAGTQENLILQRTIEATCKTLSQQAKDVSEVKVKRLQNGSISIKLCYKDHTRKRFDQTPDELDGILQKQVLPYAEEAFNSYKSKLPVVQDKLNKIFNGLGSIEARVKTPVSAANRLMRTLKATWGPKEGINSAADAVKNLWDALGSRLVVKNSSEIEMQKVVDAMCNGLRTGDLKITHLNNLRGPGGKPYFNDAQIKQLQQADAERIHEQRKLGVSDLESIQIGNSERKEGSPFTAICAYLNHDDGVTGEFQIIGEEVLKLADAEHLPYDAMINKDLYRELNDAGKKKMAPLFEPFLAAIQGLSASQKTEYNEYLNQAYIQARKVESGQLAPKSGLALPATFDPVLSVENIIKIAEQYEITKKIMKKGG